MSDQLLLHASLLPVMTFMLMMLIWWRELCSIHCSRTGSNYVHRNIRLQCISAIVCLFSRNDYFDRFSNLISISDCRVSDYSELLEKQRQVAMIIEMTHCCSLIHDDVIDASDSRRGRPSVNVLWNHRRVSTEQWLLKSNLDDRECAEWRMILLLSPCVVMGPIFCLVLAIIVDRLYSWVVGFVFAYCDEDWRRLYCIVKLSEWFVSLAL